MIWSRNRHPLGIGIALMATLLLITAGQAATQALADTSSLSLPQDVTYSSPEADIVVRVGDIDNLGFGWPEGFDVFSGEATSSHSYPWTPEPDDPAGTDRIMVGTSFDGHPPAGQDGYASATSRPDNLPQQIRMQYDLKGVKVSSAIIQMFVDDFQSPVWQSRFQVTLNGRRASFIEEVLNLLSQGGPIGKLITVQVPSEFLGEAASGKLDILIDDPTTGAGDGFAIDFVRLLINPQASLYTGSISGKVLDAETGKAIEGANVSASGIAGNETDPVGAYTLDEVPAGIVSVRASKTGYLPKTELVDLKSGTDAKLDIKLTKGAGPAPINLGKAEVKAPDRASMIQTANWGEVPANQIIVVLKEGKGRSDADRLAASLNGQVVGFVEYINMYQIQTSGSSEVELQDAVFKAKQDPVVDLAFPNQQATPDAKVYGIKCTPLDDPVYLSGRSRGYEIAGIQNAWDLIKASRLGLSEVHVGVTDDGLYKGYGEFSGFVKIDTSEPNSELTAPLIVYNKDGSIKRDYSIPGSHGTGVMNIIAADPDNGGLTGIASEPLAERLTASMVNNFASPYGDGVYCYHMGSIAAIKKEIEAGSTIISCSWGGKNAPEASLAFKRFFEKMELEHPYVLFVCAAGNDYEAIDGSRYWPAGSGLPNLITVGNIMNDGTKTPSSNMASPNFEVTLAAPGQQAVWGKDDKGNIKNDYGGTSMATPHVTAAAALIRALNPRLNGGEIKVILKESARNSINIGGETKPAPPELGGCILAIDLAVLKVINDLRAERGLASLSMDEALAASRIDLVAESDPVSASGWRVTAYVPAVETGTDVAIEVQGGSTSGSPTKHLSQEGSLNWNVTVNGGPATVIAQRLDTGGCSKAELVAGGGSGKGPLKLIAHAMARDFDKNTQEPVGQTSTFLAQDAQAVSCVKLGPVYGPHQVVWRWYAPDGTLYFEQPKTLDPASSGLDHWEWKWMASGIYISGKPAAQAPGNWKADVYIDGQQELTEPFIIAAGKSGQLAALNVEVANAVYTDRDRRLYYCVRNGLLSYRNRIYLIGPDLDKVAKVKYILDPSFEHPEVVSLDPSNNFEIWIMTWGRFPMKAVITTKSGQVFEKDYYFSFKSKVEDALARGVPQIEQC